MPIPFDVMTARILHLFRWAKEKGMTLENIGRAEKARIFERLRTEAKMLFGVTDFTAKKYATFVVGMLEKERERM